MPPAPGTRMLLDTASLPAHPAKDATLPQIRLWNAEWERILASGLRLDVIPRFPFEALLQLNHTRETFSITIVVGLSEFMYDHSFPFPPRWHGISTAERETALLKGLAVAFGDKPAQQRFYVPELYEIANLASSPEPFLALVAFFARPEHMTVRPTTCPRLSNTTFDDTYGLKEVVEGVPDNRRKRAALTDIVSARQYILLEFLIQTIQMVLASDAVRADAAETWKEQQLGMGKDQYCTVCVYPPEVTSPKFLFCQPCHKASPSIKVPYCSPECQMKDWRVHKKRCGKTLLDAVDVPTTAELASSDAPPTAGILRQFSLLSKQTDAMAFWTFLTLEGGLVVLGPVNTVNARALRDEAIARRDIPSVGEFAVRAARALGDYLPTRNTIRQIADDFEVSFGALNSLYDVSVREIRERRLTALMAEKHHWPTEGEYCSHCYRADGAIPEDFIACGPCVAAGFAVYYCSRECLTADEPLHRACCGQLTGHPLGHLPTDEVPPFTLDSFEDASLPDGCVLILHISRVNRITLPDLLWASAQGTVQEQDVRFFPIVGRNVECWPGFARGDQLARDRAIRSRTPANVAVFAWAIENVIADSGGYPSKEALTEYEQPMWADETELLVDFGKTFEVDLVELTREFETLSEWERAKTHERDMS